MSGVEEFLSQLTAHSHKLHLKISKKKILNFSTMKLLILFLTQQLIAVSSSNPTSFFHVVKDHTCKDKSQTCGDDQTCCPFGDTGFVDLSRRRVPQIL